MDHNEALQCQACEKYLLGELSPAQRDAFEEHYFSCAECAIQLRSAADFLGASCEILAANPVQQNKPDAALAPRRWFSWFMQPAFAVPAFALLLLVIGYQNFVTIPGYKQAAAPRVLPMHSLITANTLGDESLHFIVPADQPFGPMWTLPTTRPIRLISSPCWRLPAQQRRSALSMLPKPRKRKSSPSIQGARQGNTRSSFPVWLLPPRIHPPRRNSPGFSLRLKYDTSLGTIGPIARQVC